jgi:hypothetical protein
LPQCAHHHQGFSATLLRNSLSGSTFFMVFESGRLWRGRVHGCKNTEIPLFETFLCGAAAGFFYWAPFYPIDAIKSNLQADNYRFAERKFSGFAYLYVVDRCV